MHILSALPSFLVSPNNAAHAADAHLLRAAAETISSPDSASIDFLLSLAGKPENRPTEMPPPSQKSFAQILQTLWNLPPEAGVSLWQEIYGPRKVARSLARPRLSLASRVRRTDRDLNEVGEIFWGERWAALSEAFQIVLAPELDRPFSVFTQTYGNFIAFPVAKSSDVGLLSQFIHETAHVDAALKGIEGMYLQELHALTNELEYLHGENDAFCEWGFWKAISLDAFARLEAALQRWHAGKLEATAAPFLDAVYVWCAHILTPTLNER